MPKIKPKTKINQPTTEATNELNFYPESSDSEAENELKFYPELSNYKTDHTSPGMILTTSNTRVIKQCFCEKACFKYFGETCPYNNPPLLSSLLINYYVKHLLRKLFTEIEQDFLKNTSYIMSNYNDIKYLSPNEIAFWSLQPADERPTNFTTIMRTKHLQKQNKDLLCKLLSQKYYISLYRELPLSINNQIRHQIAHILNNYTTFQCKLLVSSSWDKFDFIVSLVFDLV